MTLPADPPRRRTARLGVATLVLGLVAGLLVAGLVVGGVLIVRLLGTTPQERYCEEVVGSRAELSDRLSQGTPDVLITTLPIFEDLADDAPDDITDEWRVVTTAITGLRGALRAAGVDPATYDRDDPPAEVDEDERRRIDTAARVLGSQETAAALAGLDQQARDVCRTPLTQ